MFVNTAEKMIGSAGVVFSPAPHPSFPRMCRKRWDCQRWAFSRCLVNLDLFKDRKAKNTPAHQRKFPPAPPSPCASAYAAHQVKGTLRLTTLALDLLPLLRHPLLTTAAPGEILPQGRRYRKAGKAYPVFPPCSFSLSHLMPLRFPGSAFSFSPGVPAVFPFGIVGFPRPREMLSGSEAFAFPPHAFCFPLGCLFVQHHPGGPAYVTCTRAVALYPLRLAGGCAPLTPARPAKGSGQTKDQRQ